MTRTDPGVLAVLGDFAGDAAADMASREFIEVDLDTLDAAIRKLRPEVRLDLPWCPALRFSSWRDFHPDSIAERMPALQALLYARDEVGNPSVMRQHLQEAGVADLQPERSEPAPVSPASDGPAPEGGDLLDSILGGAEGAPASSSAPPGAPTAAAGRPRGSGDRDFDRLVRSIVDETVGSQDFAGEDARRAAIDGELARRMRAILDHPRFRRVEACWSGLRGIIRAGGSAAERLRIRILDLRLAEAATTSIDPLESGPLYGLICGSTVDTPGAERFSALLGDFEIADDADDLRALAVLAALAARAGAPLLASAAAPLAEPESESDGSEAWCALRDSPLGDWIALAHPQVLLRLPYGPDTDPIDDFDFDEFLNESDELADDASHAWGSPALLLGRVLASALARTGEIKDFPHFARVEDLPVHVFRRAGEIQSVGPMRTLLSEPRIDALGNRGITAMVGRVGVDSAEVVGLRSVSGKSLFG